MRYSVATSVVRIYKWGKSTKCVKYRKVTSQTLVSFKKALRFWVITRCCELFFSGKTNKSGEREWTGHETWGNISHKAGKTFLPKGGFGDQQKRSRP